MLKLKKICLTLLFVIGGSLVLSGCGGKAEGSDSEQKTIKMANFYAEDHAVNIALKEKFVTMVEENSGGTLKVELYPNSQLGGEEMMWDGVKSGTIEMAEIGVIMEPEVPMISLFTLPFVFEDYDHAQKVLAGSVGEQIGKQIEEKANVKFLGYGVNGFRAISSNKLIEDMSDFKGFKLRAANIPQLIRQSELLGATVTPMAISEIFTGLEQGVIDGQENPIPTLKTSGWYEAQSHVLKSNHVFLPNEILVNKDFWNSLTEEEQEVIQEAVDASTKYEWEILIANEQSDIEFLEEEGIVITEPTKEFKDKMIEATEPVYTEFYEKNPWGEDVVKEILDAK